jgi:endonuclease-3
MSDEQSHDNRWRSAPSEKGKSARRWVQRNDTRIERVIDLLEANYGQPEQPGRRNALQVLVLTILSQNTTDLNALNAYESLMKSFPPDGYDRPEQLDLPRDDEGNIDSVEIRMSQVADTLPSPDWDAVRTASSSDVKEAIKTCGLQNTKGPAIQNVLVWLHEQHDHYDLNALLTDCSAEECIDLLSDIKGIGAKTAAVTVMEATEKDTCPVDTHVHRTATRIGLVEPSGSRTKTFRELNEILPDGKGFSLHHNLLTFGRDICTSRNPSCDECFLNRICRYYRNEVQEEDMTTTYT